MFGNTDRSQIVYGAKAVERGSSSYAASKAVDWLTADVRLRTSVSPAEVSRGESLGRGALAPVPWRGRDVAVKSTNTRTSSIQLRDHCHTAS